MLKDDWAEEYLKALKIRADMAEEYGDIGAWLNNFDEYKRRMNVEEAPSLDEADLLIARVDRLVVRG